MTALDPAERLLGVTRERHAAEGLEVEAVNGTAEALPFEDGSFDVVLSVFAVIFSSDPQAAAREIVRVLAPGGRALITTWRPEGATHETFKVVGEALAELMPDRAGKPFAWGDPDVLAALFAGAGGRVAIEDASVAFTATSPEEWFDEGGRSHPMGMAGRRALEAAGRAEEVRERALAVARAHNEDPDAFRSTSRYLVATIST